MDESHKTIIDKHMVALISDMDVFNIAIKLQSKHLFSDDDVDTIEAEKTDRKSRRCLLVILKTKGNTAFNLFVEALEEENQKHLAELLRRNIPSAASGSAHPTNLYDGIQACLKDMYLKRFKKINPFSLPFTFDIENTWVSLALKQAKSNQYYSESESDHSNNSGTDTESEDNSKPNHSCATEDHAELLKSAFEKEKMLIIEGKPATGKTSLMRRLAYEWAKGDQKLSHYDLVLYAEFREVREKEFETIADLMIKYTDNYSSFFGNAELANLKHLISNKTYCKEKRILILLDGYDESSLDKQCKELHEYVTASALKSPLFFNIVVSTRPGYVGQHRGKEGRYTFADILGFTTVEQKEKYILNHFSSQPEKKKQESIAAVGHLLKANKNVNTLSETPLFLTFICLVHERIIEGTILELYYNTIWWLIDRHQADNPDRDIPSLFEFYQGASDKFRTIQNNYLHFPQLLHLGKMAFNNLKKDVFHDSDCEQYNLKEIIQQVGLLRKDKFYDNSFHLTITFSFPHRTIQEFLAAIYCFCSHEQFHQGFKTYLNTSTMNEYEKFLIRIALSNKIPINEETRILYFEAIEDFRLYEICDALHTSNGVNFKLLKSLLSQCTNVVSIEIFNCIFEPNSQLFFRNSASLKYLKLNNCIIGLDTVLGITQLKAIYTLELDRCSIEMDAWQSVIEEIRKSSVTCLDLSFGGENFNIEYVNQLQKCNTIIIKIRIEDYSVRSNELLSFSGIDLHLLTFYRCSFKANSQLSFRNSASLKELNLWNCKIQHSVSLGIPQLKAIYVIEFDRCIIDLQTWKSITEEIRNSSVKRLKFAPNMSKYLEFLQNCNRIKEIHFINRLGISKYHQNDIIQELITLTQKMQSLQGIVFNFRVLEGVLNDSNKKLIEKAGKARDPTFTVSIIL